MHYALDDFYQASGDWTRAECQKIAQHTQLVEVAPYGGLKPVQEDLYRKRELLVEEEL